MDEQVDLKLVRRMHQVAAQIHDGANVAETLQAVTDGVVQCLGFAAAALNLVDQDGDLTVVAVTGPHEARAAIVGQRLARSFVEDLLDRSKPEGELAFVDHRRAIDGSGTWTPGATRAILDAGWHPGDALLAPLRTPAGVLVGLLSVDLEPGSPFPSQVVCELLEGFATSAAVAIDRARLLDQLNDERKQLRASEQAFRFAFSFSAGPMATLSLAAEDLGRIMEANEAFGAAVGLDLEHLSRCSWFDLVASEEAVDSQRRLKQFALREIRTETGERQLVRPDGTRLWVSLTSSVIETSGELAPFLLVHLHDITERRNREEILLRESTQDPLTGLANRRALHRHLEATLAAHRAGGPGGVVIYGDLNRFKHVNDNYGHAVGDAVLRRVAQRLLLLVRTDDLVARVGGDEFVIVVTDLSLSEGRNLSERIRTDLATIHHDFGKPVTISLGVVDFDVATDSAALLDRADLDMYADKHGSSY